MANGGSAANTSPCNGLAAGKCQRQWRLAATGSAASCRCKVKPPVPGHTGSGAELANTLMQRCGACNCCNSCGNNCRPRALNP